MQTIHKVNEKWALQGPTICLGAILQCSKTMLKLSSEAMKLVICGFVTAKIIASLDFISAVHMIHFIYHFIIMLKLIMIATDMLDL